MNKVMMATLGWQLLTQKEELWAKTARKKYGLSESDPSVFKHKHEWKKNAILGRFLVT